MPRSKIGKKRQAVDTNALKAAIDDVLKTGLSLGKAAKQHSVSKATLIRHLAAHKSSGSGTFKYQSNIAWRQVFAADEETLLFQYLTTAAKLHYGLSKTETRKLAYQFAKANDKAMPSSWGENQIAGKQWMTSFLIRHPGIVLRKPEATSLSRSASFNKSNIEAFFQNLKDCFTRYNFGPENIYNLDETGNSTVHVPPKVLATKGEKQIGNMTSGERGVNVTMIAAINAIGNSIPPMLIFPRVYFKPHMLKGSPVGSIGGANPSGWSNEELFLQFFEHFIRHTKPSVEDKVLLILDNHESHISIRAINLARKHGVVLLTLPPHTSHKLQPLDRTVFGPYKCFYNQVASEWMVNNPGKPISIYDISEIVGKAYPKAFNCQNITKGFEVTGIWPFNADVFGEHDFLPAYVTDRLCPESSENREVCDENAPGISNLQLCTKPKSSAVTPQVLRPFPKAAPRKRTRLGRKTGKTRILTDTPEKDEIEAKELKRKVSQPKKKAITRKVLEDSSDEENILNDTSLPRVSKPRAAKNKTILKTCTDIEERSGDNDFSGDSDSWSTEELLKLAHHK